MLELIKMFAFVLAMHNTVGWDGVPGKAPAGYSIEIYKTATHHGVDPVVIGALMLAENRSRKYDPETLGIEYSEGRYAGLFQLAAVWGSYAMKRCTEDLTCRHIPEGYRVRYSCRKRDTTCLRLTSANVNIEAAVLAVKYMMENNKTWDWRAMYRCHPKAYKGKVCRGSVRQVTSWERRLRKTLELQKHLEGHAGPDPDHRRGKDNG